MKLMWKVTFFLLLAPMMCDAAGFALYDISAAGQAMAHAYICRVDDPSAVWYNPAALAALEGTQVAINGAWIHTDSHFTPAESGVTIDSVPQNLFPANAFLSHQFGAGLTLGFGAYTPFAFRNEWPSGTPAAGISRKFELRTLFLTPSVGFQLSPNVSVGGGFDFVIADTTLEREITPTLLGPPIATRIDADTTNIGFNLGVLLNTNSNLKLAATYKSKVDLDLEGQLKAALFPAILGRSAQMSVPLPAQFMMGVSSSYDRLVFEGDFVWTGWSRFETLQIDYRAHLLPDLFLLRNWESHWSFRFGAEYHYSDELSLRGGYSYDRTPEPLESLDPILPDAQRQGFSAGFGWKDPKWGFDFGYTHLFFKDRSSSQNAFAGPDAAGEYSNSHDLLSAGFTYRW